MTYKQAIEVIESNYPPSHYAMLREALDMSIKLLREKEEEDNDNKRNTR